jgi:hypothetical protein
MRAARAARIFYAFLFQLEIIPAQCWILLPALLFIDPARIFFAGAGSINKIIMIIGLLRRQDELSNG